MDAARPLASATLQDLARLFHEHLLLLFRLGPLTPRQYVGFVRQFGAVQPLYGQNPDGSLVNQQTHAVLRPNMRSGFY